MDRHAAGRFGFAAGAVLSLALAALSLAATRTTVWTAALSSGQEVPKQVVKDTAAHGLFKATLSGDKLKWKLTFAKLTGRRPWRTFTWPPRASQAMSSCALRPLHQRHDRHGDGHADAAVRLQQASPLRERPHREEPGR